jgi:hypothetical protein
MIIGTGDLAQVLKTVDNDQFLFFASGVSNSQEKKESEYRREISLLLKQPRNYKLVYFSSLCVFYAKTRYAGHKKEMEELVKLEFPWYTIIRIGNISWGNNPHTLINFLRNKIKRGESYTIRDEFSYIIDKEEFLHWIRLIPFWNCEMNLPGRMLKVADIVKQYGHT